MKIIGQNGSTHDVYTLKIKGTEIHGVLYNPAQHVLLGEYQTIERTREVYAEIVCVSWNKEADLYQMPVE